MKRVISVSLSVVLLLVCLFSFSINAYAFDEEYVNNSGKWYKTGTSVNIDCDVLSGQLHYLLDENDGCAYFYFIYSGFDGDYDKGDVCLEFKVKNSENTYTFKISADGVDGNDALKNIDVYYDFDDIFVQEGCGRISAGFELKNKKDKSLLNYVDCTFLTDSKHSCPLLENCAFDMYVEPKAATDKSTTYKSDAKSLTTSAPKNSIKHSQTAKSTKFVPSNVTSGKSKNKSAKNNRNEEKSKYSPDSSRAQKSNDGTTEYAAENDSRSQLNENTSAFNYDSGKLSYSNSSKRAFAAAAVAVVAGIALIMFGAFSKGGKAFSKSGNLDSGNNED